MPNCTVRYVVRLVPKVPDAGSLDAIGIDAIGVFSEERMPDELGEPGYLLGRRLTTFGGAAGKSLLDMVSQGDAWHMDVQERIDPLEWDSCRTLPQGCRGPRRTSKRRRPDLTMFYPRRGPDLPFAGGRVLVRAGTGSHQPLTLARCCFSDTRRLSLLP